MQQVKLKPDHHRGQPIVRLEFPYDNALIRLAKTLDAQWSQSKRCWYLPWEKGVVNRIFNTFKGKAWIDYQQIRDAGPFHEHQASSLREGVTGEIENAVASFIDWMRNKRYSEKTVMTYRDGVYMFFRFLGSKDPAEVTHDDLERFQKDYVLAGGYSQSFQSQVINAVKLFFANRENRKLDPELIERPKKEKKLPNVLSKEEVKRILAALPNLKHRTMLSVIYGCGLRRSELLSLKPDDIDSHRRLLIVRQAKGKKDRLVPLSEKLISQLRTYYKAFKPHTWLFEGHNPGQPYSENSLRNVLKHALKKAGIQKPATLHWLRHSYATHLLEAGTDIRYIQEILGHKSSRTTEIYTHVSTQHIQQIRSPIDDL